jgi:acyl-CoA hydrolase/GNAT superfamily N-acetyltransferase
MPPTVPAAETPVPASLLPHAAKLCSAEEAAAQVRRGDHVFVGSACATPRTLTAALEARMPPPSDVEMLHFLTDGALPRDEQGQPRSAYRHRCFFVGEEMRALVAAGQADLVPVSLPQVPTLMAQGRIRVDVALIQVSLPDVSGHVSLGISVDVVAAAVAAARLVIAEVNPDMPRTTGDTLLHVDSIDHLVLVGTALIEYVHPPVPDEVTAQIARYVGGIIDDGCTLQIGLGRVTHEAMKRLADRRGLGVHSDVVTDALLPLLEAGVVTGEHKTDRPGCIVASFAMGTRRLYRFIDGNPQFHFEPIDAVCRSQVLAAQHKLVSVTQAFAIDLTGQVCADRLDGAWYGGLAAQPEFMRAAAASPGGKAIVCLAATHPAPGAGSRSAIRVALDPGESATIARSDVHFVVTEYGIAHLFGRSLRERAIALIEIAHPAHRPALFEQAQAAGLLPADQTLKNLQAYAMQDERRLVVKDGREALMRPAGATDAEGIRRLFHCLPERDVYTRFFRKLRGLSNRDVQRLCNLDRDSEVGFVAVVGPREDPQVVAHTCYFIDADTGLAETAFMIHPDWQGCGLAGAMQQAMAEHARERGVPGFVAEILASNEAMIRLARRAATQVQVEQVSGTVRVTARF